MLKNSVTDLPILDLQLAIFESFTAIGKQLKQDAAVRKVDVAVTWTDWSSLRDPFDGRFQFDLKSWGKDGQFRSWTIALFWGRKLKVSRLDCWSEPGGGGTYTDNEVDFESEDIDFVVAKAKQILEEIQSHINSSMLTKSDVDE